MSTSLFTNYDFLHEYLFRVNYDCDQCMKQPFYKDLQKVFTKVRDKDEECYYDQSFTIYLHAAHKACALLTMYVGKTPLRSYEQMYEVVYHYLYIGEYKEDDNLSEKDRMVTFNPHEIALIQHFIHAILSVKASYGVPNELIELAESHLTDESVADKCARCFATLFVDAIKEGCGEDYPININSSDNLYSVDRILGAWTEAREQLYKPIKKIAEKYQGKPIYSSIKLRAKSWQSSEWPNADLTQWICQRMIRTTKYDASLAKHFIRFWDSAEERLVVVDAIDNWSQQHPEVFKDRAQDIASLRTYASSLPQSSPEDIAVPTGQGPIRLNLRKPNVNNNDKGLTIIDVVRIFHVMHNLGMFTHESKEKLDEKDLFDALATFFDCPQLTDWSNKLSSSRGQSINPESHTEIFNTMLKKMEKIQKDLDKKKK